MCWINHTGLHRFLQRFSFTNFYGMMGLGCGSAVKYLPGVSGALALIPNTAKKKNFLTIFYSDWILRIH